MRRVALALAFALLASCELTRSVDDLSNGSHSHASCGGQKGCSACDSCSALCSCLGKDSATCAQVCGGGGGGGSGSGSGGGPALCSSGNCNACGDCLSICSCLTGNYPECEASCSTGGTGGAGGTGATGGTGGTGASSGGGTGGGTVDSGIDSQPFCGYFANTNCVLCVQALCCQEDIACANDTACSDISACYSNCVAQGANAAPSCYDDCYNYAPPQAQNDFSAIYSCYYYQCGSECYPY